VLTGLPAGQVDARRVVVGIQERRLAQEQVGVARDVDEAVAGAGVGGVRQRAAARLDAQGVGLDGVVGQRGRDRERADLQRRGVEHAPVVDLTEPALAALLQRDRGEDALGRALGPQTGSVGRRPAGS